MTTLNVVVDEAISPLRTGVSRYTEELMGALIEYAPSGCFVEGMVAASPEQDYEWLGERFPGMRGLFKSVLSRRDLTAAWQHGFTPVPSGMIHAPSLFAPLRNHDRVNTRGRQIAVTIHDVTAWTRPELLTPRQVTWTKAMAQRALKYADAVVVPTHATAAELGDILDFGERVRVLGGAVSERLTVPVDASSRATRLGLPERYLLTTGDSSGSSEIGALLSALSLLEPTDIPLLVAGEEYEPGALAAATASVGLANDRVRSLGQLDDADLSVVLDRATVFVYPKTVSGFGMPMLEAFRFGTPVIHAGTAALREVASDAGISVPEPGGDAYPRLIADAIQQVLEDDGLQRRLSILGADRAKLFSWRALAEGVWQLHADL